MMICDTAADLCARSQHLMLVTISYLVVPHMEHSVTSEASLIKVHTSQGQFAMVWLSSVPACAHAAQWLTHCSASVPTHNASAAPLLALCSCHIGSNNATAHSSPHSTHPHRFDPRSNQQHPSACHSQDNCSTSCGW